MSWSGQSFRFSARNRKPYVSTEVRAIQLLAFIVDYQSFHCGVSPSFPEMMEGAGISSKSGVHRALAELVAKRKIRTLPDRARAIEVLAQVVGAAPQVIDRTRKPLVAPGPQAQFFVVEKLGDWDDARLVPMEGKSA